MSTPANYFNEREHQICLVARMVEDARTYWVAGGGSPMASILLAKMLYAPNAVYVTEDGVINPEPMLPLDPIMTMVSSRASYRALQWGTMNSVGFQAQIGLMDFGSPGGADSIAALCWKTILMTDQQARKFVPRVDFISSPGFLDGTEGARERAGLPRGTQPWRVVTPWALFDYEDRYLRLIGVSPFVTVDEVLAEMSFKPKMAKDIQALQTPTEEELALLRTKLDQQGQITDVGKPVVRLDDGTFAFGESQ